MSDDARKHVLQRDEDRLLVLTALYTISDGEVDSPVGPGELFTASRMKDGDRFNSALEYLLHERLAERPADDYIALTHAGRLEYEDAQRSPGSATKHFSQTVIFNVRGSIGSIGAIVSGDGNTTNVQQQTNHGFRADEVKALLLTLAEQIESIGEDERAAAKVALAKVEHEIATKAENWLERSKVGLEFLKLFPPLVATVTTVLSYFTATP